MSFTVLFNLILTVATVVTGIIWSIERFSAAPKRARRVAATGIPEKQGAFSEFFGGLFPVIAAVFVIRSFLYEPFRIPSGSMIPTLHVGDFILVNKFSYGLRCPVGGCKIVELGEPKRGDVVVFIYPNTDASDPNRGNDFIKRVIGTPGDRIQYAGKRLTVNGVEAPISMAAVQSDVGYGDVRMHEDFGGVKHDILIKPDRVSDPFSCPFVQPNGDNFEFTVPPGHYFMMGDNRDGSNDSRCWGTVPEANLKGRAELVWMSWDHERARPVLSRIGTLIR
ncbi:MAG: signal peptidase I [Gammaproteobacteria bacterium]|jgi:signal peptidase I|uniref:signal peptidase I n=1 Tax=Nevskia sp. TaxID=1929292 RepID=UPI003F71E28E|nr:signal peptidase I [Gammaproteobacteria bacterium]